VALVWPNGVGKSTFMKILSSEIKDYEGSIENVGGITLGYLEQIHFRDETISIRDTLRDSFEEIRTLEKEIEEEELLMSETGEFEKYTELIERFKLIGGYTYENEVERVSRWIGIFHLLESNLMDISGGERTKVALAKILLSKPNFLLLDEPTNFIDLQSLEWLEKYLIETWKGGYLIVSHDREFLDNTCTTVIEVLWPPGIEVYHGDYSFSVLEKKKRREKAEKKYEEQQTMIESEKTLINRFRAGSRAGFAKSRERALERVELLEKPEVKRGVQFLFPYEKWSPENVLKAEDVFIWRKEPLFYIREVLMTKWERIWIVWENGVGKSTFLKTILREIKPLEWYLHLHENISCLSFSQMHETLDETKTIRENFFLHGLDYTDDRVGGIIQMYGFEFFDREKKVKSLSGGERSKILFAILGQKNSNLLILDEPTNHLDYEAREFLEKALLEYPGTILFISHDRYFVNKIATKLWIIEDNEMMTSYGNYEDYRYKREHGISLDMSLFNLDGELDLVLEEKLWVQEARRIKEKFARRKTMRGK
jgi:ATP-binding cassette subfamily F protein 3